MPLSVRLDKKTESLLEQTASTLKTSKAEVIKKSLSDYCARVLTERRKRLEEHMKHMLGKEKMRRGDLSARSEELLRERFRRRT